MNKKHNHHDDHHNHHSHDNHCHHVPCFVSGSQVVTMKGLVDVKLIRPGDMIMTRDNGYKEVAWSGCTHGYGFVDLFGTRVSKNHRMIMRETVGNDEVLVPAKFLGTVINTQRVQFVHFMFDQHEIVCVDGVWSESFRPGQWILDNMNKEQSREIYDLFPEFMNGSFHQLARTETKLSNAVVFAA